MFHPDIVCVLKERKRVGIFNPQVFAGCHNRKTAQKNNKPHTHTHTHTHTHKCTHTHTEQRGNFQECPGSEAKHVRDAGHQSLGQTALAPPQQVKVSQVEWELLWGVSSGNLPLIFKVTPQKASA